MHEVTRQRIAEAVRAKRSGKHVRLYTTIRSDRVFMLSWRTSFDGPDHAIFRTEDRAEFEVMTKAAIDEYHAGVRGAVLEAR